MTLRRLVSAGAFAALVLLPGAAVASELDAAVVLPARYAALGGAAQGGARGAAALSINPAGLGRIEAAEVHVGVAAEVSVSQGHPGAEWSGSSQPYFALLPGAAAGLRLDPWLAVGLSVTPRGTLGASYGSTTGSGPWSESRFAYELAPAVVLSVPRDVLDGELTFGAAYRLTFAGVELARPDGALSLTGVDATGVRLGAQYQPVPELRLGVAWSSAVSVGQGASSGTYAGQAVQSAATSRAIPQILSAGGRIDIDRFGLGLDYEFAGTGDLDRSELTVTTAASEATWGRPLGYRYGHRLRAGLEYRLPLGADELAMRVGYGFGSAVTSASFPEPAGLPPAATHTPTLGAGYRERYWECNLAVYGRFGSTRVEAEQLGSCSTCGGAGEYGIATVGAALDFSMAFE